MPWHIPSDFSYNNRSRIILCAKNHFSRVLRKSPSQNVSAVAKHFLWEQRHLHLLVEFIITIIIYHFPAPWSATTSVSHKTKIYRRIFEVFGEHFSKWLSICVRLFFLSNIYFIVPPHFEMSRWFFSIQVLKLVNQIIKPTYMLARSLKLIQV